MSANELVTDPLLRKVLEALGHARDQGNAMIGAKDNLDKLGKKATKEQWAEYSKMEKRLHVRLALLRVVYRKAVYYIRDTKQETANARQEVDTLHLQLQNLNYEQQHLRGEIAACEDYEHVYQKLPMITKEEFLALHPEHEDSTEHDLTIARIQDEHAARVALQGQHQQLVAKKDELQKEINEDKKALLDLDDTIESYVADRRKVSKKLEAHELKMEKKAAKEAEGS